ncbi:MAG: ABC transporter ATP-binding protein [Clostridia bacterium]|nr:ABC transporter ATP-binding protein [Clostridia bacterium]
MNGEILLSVKGLKKYFPMPKKNLFQKERPFLRANDDITFDIKKGEVYGLVGESGSGKSTLGRTVLQLYKPTEGSVRYYGRNKGEFFLKGEKNEEEGIELSVLSKAEMRKLRRDLQIVFQDPYSSLNPRMTVGELIEEGAVTHGFYKKDSNELHAYAESIMTSCGLRADMLRRYPHQFSGGQRQRVCIARALAVQPKFIVCDECVSALDLSVQSQILNLLSELKEREKLTYLFISHDLSVVRYISDRIGVMYLGKIVEEGDAKEIFENPRHPYTVALLSAVPTIERRKKEGEQIFLEGSMPSPVSPPKGCPFHTRCFMAEEICQRIPAPAVKVGNGHRATCHFAEVTTEEKREIAQRKGGKTLLKNE